MSNDKDAKGHLAERLDMALNPIIGMPVRTGIKEEIKTITRDVFNTFKDVLGLHAPIPVVVVSVHTDGDKLETVCTIEFSDPITGKIISADEWVSRAMRGFYDR